jgi:hypothetical protein
MEILDGDASRGFLAERVKFRKGHVPQYMISRAFIPPWSLVMRDRKLLDQTLPVTEAGTLVSPLARTYDLAAAKSRRLCTRPSRILPPWTVRASAQPKKAITCVPRDSSSRSHRGCVSGFEFRVSSFECSEHFPDSPKHESRNSQLCFPKQRNGGGRYPPAKTGRNPASVRIRATASR